MKRRKIDEDHVGGDPTPTPTTSTKKMKIPLRDAVLDPWKVERRAVTAWYRAPEALLFSEFHNFPLDVWSLGCIFAEMVIGRVLFQGRDEAEMLPLILECVLSKSNYENIDGCVKKRGVDVDRAGGSSSASASSGNVVRNSTTSNKRAATTCAAFSAAVEGDDEQADREKKLTSADQFRKALLARWPLAEVMNNFQLSDSQQGRLHCAATGHIVTQSRRFPTLPLAAFWRCPQETINDAMSLLRVDTLPYEVAEREMSVLDGASSSSGGGGRQMPVAGGGALELFLSMLTIDPLQRKPAAACLRSAFCARNLKPKQLLPWCDHAGQGANWK
ncbi:unnamed protein product [Amoebophrya sp. A25]|nr:unnamed protein product [Amoebophrya sp. A25]|eukprot:GSA25T00007869001.1